MVNMTTACWAVVILIGGALPALASERPMMRPVVPSEQLAEARALKNPLPDSPDLIDKGKALYEGKGGCVNCHGKSGLGDGPVAGELNPSPRNFHHRGFWRHRTEGEIFWVIKHGSLGTAMIGFNGQLTDEEIWTIIPYLRAFAGGHGSRGGMGRRGMQGAGTCCKDDGGIP